MTNLSKFIYWLMLVICTYDITMGVINGNVLTVVHNIALLGWVGVAYVLEKRCVKLQEKIDELYGNN
jgi:hypothetical protein